MKDMKYLISHMKNVPYFARFKSNDGLILLKKALPSKFRDNAHLLYIKNNSLIFVFF